MTPFGTIDSSAAMINARPIDQYLDFTTAPGRATLHNRKPDGVESIEVTPDMLRALPGLVKNGNRDFERGYMIAVSNIMHLHGEDTIARNVLEQLGSTKAAMERMGFSDYDLKPLRALFREIARLGRLEAHRIARQVQS